MKINSILIENTFGTERAEFNPGTVTRIRGKNESGKSSIIKALMYVFDGGSDPAVIRRGTKKSVVKLALEGGTTVTKTTTPGGSRLDIIDGNGLVVPSPQKFIQGLSDSLQVNPGRLLQIDASTAAGKKALIQALLETMPIAFTAADIAAVAPVTETDGKPQPGYAEASSVISGAMNGAALDLDGLAKLRKQIEDSRRAVGVQAKEADGRARGLLASITGDDDVAAAKARAAELGDELRHIEQAQATEKEGIDADYAAEERAAREELQRKLADITERKAVALTNLMADVTKEREPRLQEAAILRERIRAAENQGILKAQAERERKTHQEHQSKYDQFTCALELIDGARKAKLDNLPIPGVTFENGDVLVNGVRWQDVNLASRVSVAVQNATLGKGKLDLILWDDGEHLDTDTDRMLVDALKGAGYQVMTCQVVDGAPLTITTEGN